MKLKKFRSSYTDASPSSALVLKEPVTSQAVLESSGTAGEESCLSQQCSGKCRRQVLGALVSVSGVLVPAKLDSSAGCLCVTSPAIPRPCPELGVDQPLGLSLAHGGVGGRGRVVSGLVEWFWVAGSCSLKFSLKQVESCR